MRTDRSFVKRRQARAERRNARAKRRLRESGFWGPNLKREDVATRLKRAFTGIQPMTPYQRMANMERAQALKMKEVYGK